MSISLKVFRSTPTHTAWPWWPADNKDNISSQDASNCPTTGVWQHQHLAVWWSPGSSCELFKADVTAETGSHDLAKFACPLKMLTLCQVNSPTSFHIKQSCFVCHLIFTSTQLSSSVGAFSWALGRPIQLSHRVHIGGLLFSWATQFSDSSRAPLPHLPPNRARAQLPPSSASRLQPGSTPLRTKCIRHH